MLLEDGKQDISQRWNTNLKPTVMCGQLKLTEDLQACDDMSAGKVMWFLQIVENFELFTSHVFVLVRSFKATAQTPELS